MKNINLNTGNQITVIVPPSEEGTFLGYLAEEYIKNVLPDKKVHTISYEPFSGYILKLIELNLNKSSHVFIVGIELRLEEMEFLKSLNNVFVLNERAYLKGFDPLQYRVDCDRFLLYNGIGLIDIFIPFLEDVLNTGDNAFKWSRDRAILELLIDFAHMYKRKVEPDFYSDCI